jgi:hypothetical protein
MNTTAAPSLFDHTELHTDHTRTFINPILWFVDCDGFRVVFCRHEILHRVALDDAPSLALVAVSLRLSELATQIDIAAAFGHSVATQRRWETRYLQFGAAGLLPRSRAGRSAKLDRGQRAFVLRWCQQGVSNQEMARRLGVSEATIRRVLRQAGLRRRTTPQPELPLIDNVASPAVPPPAVVAAPAAVPTSAAIVPAVAVAVETTPANTDRTALVGAQAAVPETLPANGDATATPSCSAASPPPANPLPASNVPANLFSIDSDPADRSGDRALACQGFLHDATPLFGDHEELPRAGVLVAIPALQAHGGLEVFARLFGSVLGPAFYGLRTTVLSLFLMALLRIKRPENLKEYSPERLGCLLGLDRIAEVKTLRRKLTLLAKQGKGRELMKELARLRLLQGEKRLAFLYVDGHVREYSGQGQEGTAVGGNLRGDRHLAARRLRRAVTAHHQ